MAMKTNLERSTCRSNGKNDFIEKEEKMENSPPDGGWGWMIVFAVFVGNCLFDGIIGSYGILYPAVQKTFGSNSAVTSMAGSLVAGVYQISSKFCLHLASIPWLISVVPAVLYCY